MEDYGSHIIDTKALVEYLARNPRVRITVTQKLRSPNSDALEWRLIFYGVDNAGNIVIPGDPLYFLFSESL